MLTEKLLPLEEILEVREKDTSSWILKLNFGVTDKELKPIEVSTPNVHSLNLVENPVEAWRAMGENS